jgi:type I restriction enzyme R subunit
VLLVSHRHRRKKTYTAFQIIHRLWKSPGAPTNPAGKSAFCFWPTTNILVAKPVSDFRPSKAPWPSS